MLQRAPPMMQQPLTPAFAKATAGNSAAKTSGVGAGNGIRTRDFDLGKVALYH